MNIEFLIKYTFQHRKNMILLLLQTIIYIYFLINFFSISLFKDNFIEAYSKYYPINNGMYVINNDIANVDAPKNIHNGIIGFVNYLQSNKNVDNYRFYLFNGYSESYFGIDYSKYSQKYKNDEGVEKSTIPCFKINYSYYNELKRYISGVGFKDNDFIENGQYIPVVLGKNFKKDFRIGQVLIGNDNNIKLIVAGFLKENALILTAGDPISNSMSLEGSFILPLINEELDDPENAFKVLNNLIIQVNKKSEYKEVWKEIEAQAKSLGLNIDVRNFQDGFNKFFTIVEGEIRFETIRIITLTVLAFGSLTLSLLYSINARKKDIGILYAVGSTTKDIVVMICFEAFVVTIFGYIISLPLYMYLGKEVIFFFMNSFSWRNLGTAFILNIVISIISLIVPCYKILKLKPRELIGGFRE